MLRTSEVDHPDTAFGGITDPIHAGIFEHGAASRGPDMGGRRLHPHGWPTGERGGEVAQHMTLLTYSGPDQPSQELAPVRYCIRVAVPERAPDPVDRCPLERPKPIAQCRNLVDPPAQRAEQMQVRHGRSFLLQTSATSFGCTQTVQWYQRLLCDAKKPACLLPTRRSLRHRSGIRPRRDVSAGGLSDGFPPVGEQRVARVAGRALACRGEIGR
jgi:hypothetical protein